MTDLQDAATHALARLDELGDAESRNIYDPHLREALRPLAGIPAVEFHCSRCQKRIAWWALHRDLALVVFAERRSDTKIRRPGASDLDQSRSSAGFEPWIDQAQQPGGRIEITEWADPKSTQNNVSGYPLRATFHCRCGAQYVTKNTTRLRKFLGSQRVGSSRIGL